MLLGKKESLVIGNDTKALAETIDEGVNVFRKKRINTVADGYCLIW